jgi:hypothetical protein
VKEKATCFVILSMRFVLFMAKTKEKKETTNVTAQSKARTCTNVSYRGDDQPAA